MNAPAPPLAAILARASRLLLDFDGPMCRLFAGQPAPAVAAQLLDLVAAHGATVRGPDNADDGPLQVLRRVADLNDGQLTRRVADAVRDAEVAASASAAPTAGARDVLDAARATGRRVAVVSNNSADAVRAYLARHDLTGHVERVIARYDGMDPRLLKPEDHLVRVALKELDAPPADAVFVGDSLSDITAGRAAAVPVIAYANKPNKRQLMTDARADVVIDTMAELANALRAAL